MVEKICPVCGVNFIEDDADMCSICSQSSNSLSGKPQNHTPRKNVYFSVTFTSSDEPGFYGGHYGFKGFNTPYETQLLKFKDYLVNGGYSEFTPKGHPSTAFQYANWIEYILDEESFSIEDLNLHIDEICDLYDRGGAKQKIGERGHSSVINALKRYREFLSHRSVNR